MGHFLMSMWSHDSNAQNKDGWKDFARFPKENCLSAVCPYADG